MNFLKDFFTSVSRSMYDIRWMKERRGDTNKAWTYFFMFMILLVAIQSVAVMWAVPRGVRMFWETARQQIPEFHAEVVAGELFLSGFEQPFILEEYDNGEIFSVYIDTLTDESISPEQVFEDRVDTGVLITKDKLTAVEYGGLRTRGFSFREIDDMTFSGGQIIEWVDHFIESILPYMIPLLMIVLFLVWSGGKLIYLILVAFIVWFIAIFGKKEWKFGEVYTTGLYALTGPTILMSLFMWTGLRAPMLYTGVLMLYLLLVVFKAEKEVAVSIKRKSIPKKAKKK
ncbi:MAG: DUF1189 family protein [Candidatus Magasanikbacteria bacterium]